MSQSVSDIQDEIIEEFSMLDGDMEMTIGYIMELGDQLPEMAEALKTEDNIVKGCQSKVWLNASLESNQVQFEADSNTAITKGLVSILVRVLSGRSPQEIVDADLYFIDKIGLNRFNWYAKIEWSWGHDETDENLRIGFFHPGRKCQPKRLVTDSLIEFVF